MLAVPLLTVTVVTIFAAANNDEGNIHLLEDEIAKALKTCSVPGAGRQRGRGDERSKRSDNNQYKADVRRASVDVSSSGDNQYAHERRDAADMAADNYVHHLTEYNHGDVENGTGLAWVGNYSATRIRRSGALLGNGDGEHCLSQCVFANLQVVDSHGIPRESQLWGVVQDAVTSQQTRSALREQLRACFKELQAEAEDNGCSYSNQLERCLMLRLGDRMQRY